MTKADNLSILSAICSRWFTSSESQLVRAPVGISLYLFFDLRHEWTPSPFFVKVPLQLGCLNPSISLLGMTQNRRTH